MIVCLSADAKAVLRAKATQYGLSQRQLLDMMVTEFAPSTAADLAAQQRRRDRRHAAFAAAVPACPPAVAFRAGYSAAWWDYQLRHAQTFIARVRAAQGAPSLEAADD